ncbi:peptide ABC transporter substrate-binding protein [bacterium]|nr:MAG: peptide ABC transporter substrate-binding protein [bacterium]
MLSLLLRIKKIWETFSGVEKKLLLFFIGFILLNVGAAIWLRHTGTEAPAYGGQYVEGLEGQPGHINPLLASPNAVDADLARIIFNGVLKFDSQQQLVPDLATGLPNMSSSGKEYTIKLRDKIYWHDGAQLTADDVVFTYQLIQNADFSSPLRFSWNRVTVEKIDNLTVKVTTRESSSTFLANLTVGILPKHLWENIPATSFALSKLNLEPVGTGPFQIKSIKRGGNGEIRSMSLQSYNRYFAGRPYLKTLTFNFYQSTDQLISAYQSREIMGLGYIPFDRNLFLDPKNKLQKVVLPLPQYQAVFFNRAKNPAALGDINVRLALAKSVDKKKITDDVFAGLAGEAYGPILPGMLGYHEQIPGADMNIYDAEKAKALLEKSNWIIDPGIGFRKDKQGRILTVELATNTFTPNVRVAEQLKQMWEAIGVQVVLRIETVADLEQNFIRPRNYELLLFSENVGADPDPFSFWHSSQVRDPGSNFAMYSNKTADKLLVDARANILPADRAAKYRQFQEIFVGDVPAIFLDRNVYVYYIPTSLKGATFNSVVTTSERFANVNQWYLATKRIHK